MDLGLIGMYAGITMILGIPLNVYCMLTKLEVAENYLRHSVFIVDSKQLFRRQVFEGRPMRILLLAYVLIMPKVFDWRRLVDLEEVASIPIKLKCWIIIPCVISALSGIIMTVAVLIVTYR